MSDRGTTRWVGVVSLTNGAMDGTVSRVILKDNVAYAAVWRKGIFAVDLSQVEASFPTLYSAEYWQMVPALNTDGRGWGAQNAGQRVAIADPYGAGVVWQEKTSLTFTRSDGPVKRSRIWHAPPTVVE